MLKGVGMGLQAVLSQTAGMVGGRGGVGLVGCNEKWRRIFGGGNGFKFQDRTGAARQVGEPQIKRETTRWAKSSGLRCAVATIKK